METNEMMYELVSKGDLQGLKTLVEQHTKDEVQLMVTATSNGTPLVRACSKGRVDIVEYLIDECGADIDQCGWVTDVEVYLREASPVWWAVGTRHLNVVQLLQTRGANMNGDASRPIFILACQIGDLQMVKYLLTIGTDIKVVDADGANGLMCACCDGHCEVATYLIQMGLDVNLRNNDGKTALLLAITYQRLNCMKLLLRCGAELDDVWSQLMPLLMIRGTEDPQMVEYVINLPFSTRPAKIEGLESLGAKYVNIEIDQQGGLTNGRKLKGAPSDVDGEVVDSKTDVDNVACGHRTTLVDMDQFGNKAEEMRVDALLIRKPIVDGQLPNVSYFVDHIGQMKKGDFYELWLFAVEMQRKAAVPNSQLIKACLPKYDEIFLDMISGDHPVAYEVIMAVFIVAVHEIKSEMLFTMNDTYVDEVLSMIILVRHLFVLKPSMSTEHFELFRRVLGEFVGANPRGINGWTPLHFVCFSLEEEDEDDDDHSQFNSSTCEVVKWLLDVGADPRATDAEGNSPLHLAALSTSVNRDLIKLLLSHGASFDAKNSDGKCFNDLLDEGERFDPRDFMTSGGCICC